MADAIIHAVVIAADHEDRQVLAETEGRKA